MTKTARLERDSTGGRNVSTKLQFGWQTRKPWERFNHNLFHVSVYSWFPFDAHVDILWTRWRISLFYRARSIAVEARLYPHMVILDLSLGLISFHLSGFWDFFRRDLATEERSDEAPNMDGTSSEGLRG